MTALTTQQQQQHSMEEHWLWYLAGTFDTAGSFSVKIQQKEDYAIGYTFQPIVSLSRNEKQSVVFGMIDEYAEEHGVSYRIEENRSSTNQLIIDRVRSIENFLEPIAGGFVQQQEQVEVMLEEIIPAVLEDKHRTQSGFYELMDSVEVLRESLIDRRDPKFTKEYFAEEWGIS